MGDAQDPESAWLGDKPAAPPAAIPEPDPAPGYELDLDCFCNGGDEPAGVYSKGHWVFSDDHLDDVTSDSIEHRYWREEERADRDVRFLECEPDEPGAYPVTIWRNGN
jgi:hypothetical protein